MLTIKKIEIKEISRGDQLPDIDTDFCAEHRDTIKNYLKEKYGNDYTCSVGTYGRLKLRQTFKDLAKIEGVPFKDANDLTKKIDDQHEYEFFDLFKYGMKDRKLYTFIQQHPAMINKLRVVLNNPKSVSIHPSAILILPKKDSDGRDRNLDNWLPIREIDGVKISEWEGKYCDLFGLLKNDILGLSQLDKFTYCLNLIKRNYNEDIDLDKIDFEDEKTFRLFQKGFNEDIFQFGSRGLKSYSKEVLPDCLDDLIAMNALYRPGAMSVNAHHDYALIKHGEKKPEYDWELEEITRDTYGLLIYQEQIMKVFVKAGFSLVEADGVRTKMKKFDAKGMALLKDDFLKRIQEKGCELEVADKIWTKVMAFSGYGFNQAHAAAYGIIAYQGQWLKANYPLEFWTTAMNFGKEDVDIPYHLSEIKESRAKIKVETTDINRSTADFVCNPELDTINWSLIKIKGLAEKAVEKILSHRKKVGSFKSLEHFISCVPKKDANKKIVTNLIISGAFDSVEGIKNKSERAELLLKFYDLMGHNALECSYLTHPLSDKEYYWILQQKNMTGNGELDFEAILKNSNAAKKIKENYIGVDDFFRLKIENKTFHGGRNKNYSMCGFVNDFKVYMGKKGEFCKLNLEVNSRTVECVLFTSSYEEFKESIPGLKGKMIAVYGNAGWDDYRRKNTIYFNDNSEIVEL